MGLHLHEMRDTDTHFIIDPVTRAISNTQTTKKLMQYDHNSEIFTFEIPRYVDNHDMQTCEKIEVHYINIDSKTKDQSKDVYLVTDAALEADTLVFSWLVSGNATKYAGSLNFLIRFSCLDEAGNVVYRWNTDIFKTLSVSDGFSNTESVVADFSDTLEQWKIELENAGGAGSAGKAWIVNVTDSGEDAYISDKSFSQIAEAIAAGKEPVCVYGAFHYQLASNNSSKIVFYNSECDAVIAYRTITFDNSNGGTDITFKHEMPRYQFEVDSRLETSDTTIVGAINEVNKNVKDVINNGTIVSENADFAEVGEWADGNPDAEDRTGYFVSVDTSAPGKTMVKSTTDSDVRGVTIAHPAFSANASADKYNADGNLLAQYDYICFAGFAPVIDNGTCEVNGRCMPADDGTAIPSPNNMGYQIIERIDDTHVLVLVEPQADMLVRIKEDVDGLKSGSGATAEQAAQIEQNTADIAELKQAGGTAGEDGGYYQPTVDVDGNLSWAPSKSDMPAVSVANIRGPQGEKGDTGATGPAGADGADGQPGTDGKSAYQYAQEGGYTGTEDEFAALLAKSNTLPSWKKIAEITMDVETSVVDVTADSERNAFECEEMYILADLLKPSSLSAATFVKPQVSYYVGGSFYTVCNNATNNDTVNKYYTAHIQCVKNANVLVHHTFSKFPYNLSATECSMTPFHSSGIWNIDAIRAIRIQANDGKSDYTLGGVGSKIYVFGR